MHRASFIAICTLLFVSFCQSASIKVDKQEGFAVDDTYSFPLVDEQEGPPLADDVLDMGELIFLCRLCNFSLPFLSFL